MAIINYNITAYPAMQFLPASNNVRYVVSVPSGSPAVSCYSDAQGQTLLGTCAGGSTINFTNYGGFYYTSTQPSGASVVASSIKLTSSPAFTTVSNTGAETVTCQLLLPASILFNTGVLKVRYQIKCTGVTSTPTLAAKLYLGSAGTTADTAIQTAATTAILANGIITGEVELVVGAVPSAASPIVGTGTFALAGAAGQAVVNSTLSSTNFATNAALYLTLTLTWSASSASNIAAATLFVAELL